MSENPIKELRELTGSGFVDCKKALDATNGNMQEAIKWLQENGIAKAIKKSGRIAAEGLVATRVNDEYGVIYEVNSETDFVAKNDKFIALVNEIGDTHANVLAGLIGVNKAYQLTGHHIDAILRVTTRNLLLVSTLLSDQGV